MAEEHQEATRSPDPGTSPAEPQGARPPEGESTLAVSPAPDTASRPVADRTAHLTRDLLASLTCPAPDSPLTSTDVPTIPRSDPQDRTQETPYCRAPRVQGYRALRLLGEGTFGQVWLYEEDHCRRKVAIKFLKRRTTLEWQALQAEVKQLALLSGDPGIVQLRDVEPDHDPPFYVMNYAEGGSLAERLQAGPLPVAQALGIFTQVAEALAYVHAKGVRHCDLKPGNILLDKVGRALVGDFGQAHFEQDSSPVLGTFFYMAPEQADLRATIPDTRWDVYGLGALGHAMLTGKPPRSTDVIREQLNQTESLAARLQLYREHAATASRPAAHRQIKGVDRYFADIIDRCLEIDPAKRFLDAGAVLAALRRRQRIIRNRPFLIAALTASVLVLTMLAWLSRWVLTRALQEAERTLTEQLQQSDLTAARMIACAAGELLDERRRLVEERSGGTELRRAIEARAGRDELEKLLAGAFDDRLGKNFDAVFLVDSEGQMLAHRPGRPGQPLPCLPWRDWFHGRGDRQGEAGPFRPVRRTHISQPYLADMPSALAVAISVPIFAADDPHRVGEPLALLVARFPITDLGQWVGGVNLERGFLVLLNDRYHCLVHREAEKIRPHQGRTPRDYSSTPIYREILQQGRSGTGIHRDPIDDRVYLVSYAAFSQGTGPNCRWGVLVQHEPEAVRVPVEGLRAQMRLIGLLTLGGSATLLTVLWAWLIVTLRREEMAD